MLIGFVTVAGLLAVLLAIGLIALFYWACKSFEGVFALTLLLFCVEAATVGLPILSVGRNIQLFDPLAVIVFLAGIARMAFGAKKRIELPQWLLISMFVLMIVPLGLGFRKYGMAAAPDFRWFFHFMAFALYGSSFDFEQIQFRRLIKYTLLSGAALATLVYFRWAAEAAGLGIANTWLNVGAGRRFRVLNAAQAYFLAQAALLFLMTRATCGISPSPANRHPGGRFSRNQHTGLWQRSSVAVAGLGLLTSIALMHRSVWVSVLSGIALLAVLRPELRKDFARMFGVSAILASLVLVPLGLLGYLDSYFEAALNSVTEVGEYHSSFADRYMGWQTLLRDWWNNGNALTYALGQPFGSGYYRRMAEFGASYFAEYTPHSFYVQTLLRTGFVGLAIFVSMLFVTGMGNYRSLGQLLGGEDAAGAFRVFLLVCVAMQAVVMLVYGARLEQGLLFGLAMAAASTSGQSQPRHLAMKAA